MASAAAEVEPFLVEPHVEYSPLEEVHPFAVEVHPFAGEVRPFVVEVHPFVVEVHPFAVEVHPFVVEIGQAGTSMVLAVLD